MSDPRRIHVRLVEGADADRALDLAEATWGTRPVDQHLLRALELAGSYVSVAETVDGELIGMCLGIVGVHDGRPHLHSHLAAVRPEARGRGVGVALKRHQRQWCLANGIEEVSWTFDPLLHANARFNLHHLGVHVDRYLVELYGEMHDDLNRGDASDRLLVAWALRDQRAVAALDGPLPVPEVTGAEVAVADRDGAPEVRPATGPMRLVATPADAIGLRRHDPERALEWRHAVRATMQQALADGLRPVAVTADRCYVFVAEEHP